MVYLLIQLIFFSLISISSSYPKPLAPEEEKYFLERLASGDAQAANVLIERNMRLVAHIVKKYTNHFRDTEDLISVGTIGLIKAIRTYSSGRGTKLATYAARCIDNEILMTLRSSKKYANDVSLQGSIGVDKEGNEVTIEAKLTDDKVPIDEQINLKMQIRALYEKLRTLNEREVLVLEMRYGLGDGNERTQREIADILGISRSYVSRIEKKALKKLGKELGGRS